MIKVIRFWLSSSTKDTLKSIEGLLDRCKPLKALTISESRAGQGLQKTKVSRYGDQSEVKRRLGGPLVRFSSDLR